MADKIITLTKEPAPASNTTRLIEDDNKTYTIQFIITRYWGGVDLSTLNWSANLKTASNEKYYSIISAVTYNDNSIYLSWNVGAVATIVHGKTFYTIEGRDTTTQTDPPVWRSSIQEIDVGTAISAEDIFTPEDISAIEALINEVRSIVEDSVVRFDITQNLTDAQKLTARNNIGAESSVSNNTLILA